MTEHGQDPFDQLPELYRTAITLEDLGETENDLTAEEIERRVINYIQKNKRYPNLENLFNLLGFLYKFIVYKLIPLNQNLEASEQAFNPENELHLFLGPDSVEMLASNPEFDLKAFNMNNIRLKNIHQMWRFLVRIFLNIKS